MSNYKLLLVGDNGVGKTTLIHRLLNGEFVSYYKPTTSIEVKKLSFNSNYGIITFDIHDTPGKEKFSKIKNNNSSNLDAIMGLCDITSESSVNNLDLWYNIMNSNGLPSIACGNKFDVNKHKLPEIKKMGLVDKWGMYYDISAKTNYDYEKPFLYLARKLSSHNDLVFTPFPPVKPPEISCL